MNPLKSAVQFLTKKSYYALFYDNRLPDADRHWGKTDFLKANEISLYTNRAIDKRAEKVSEVEFVLVNRKDEEVVEDHPILLLLNRPNEFQTARQFWGLYQKYLDLVGSAFIWIETGAPTFDRTSTKIKALHLLRPDYVRVNYGADGLISGFNYSKPRGGVTTYTPEEIVYAYRPDPLNPTEGVSLLKAGIRTIDTELQLTKYHASVLKNGGKIESVMKFKTPSLTQQQLKDLKQQYEQQFAEAKNSGKPMFLGGDADILKLGMSPDELSFLESKRLILDDISMLTGVPKVVLGVATQETFSNAQAAIDIFLRETVKPLLSDLTTILDWTIVPDEFDLEFIDPTPENVELKLKETESGIKNYYMTINEARDRHALPPIPDGDQILAPFSLMPLDKVGEEQPSSQDNQDNQDNQDTEEKSLKPHPLRNKDVRERYGSMMVKRLDRNHQRVIKSVRNYFVEQKKRIIERIVGTRTFRHKDFIDGVFDHVLEINLAKAMLLPLIRQILLKAGTDAADLAGATRPFLLSSSIEGWLDTRAHIFATQITETTFNDLKAAFRNSLDAGESRQQLVARIRDVYDGYDETRATTIARTEVHAATQEGTIDGYQQAGLDTKIWVWAPGVLGGVREDHLAMDGEEVPINAPFSNGLDYPGDPSADPEDTINCSCSI